MKRLRLLVCRVSVWGTFCLGLLLIFSQWTELKAHTESVPLGSTVTFLALSGLAFNWSKVEDTLVTPTEKRVAKQAGVDLFCASMMALVTQGLVWSTPLVSKVSPSVADLVLVFHTGLLALSILMAWLPIRRLLMLATELKQSPL